MKRSGKTNRFDADIDCGMQKCQKILQASHIADLPSADEAEVLIMSAS